MLKRVLAVLVVMLVAVIAIRIAVGVVVGLVSTVLWIAVAVALVAAVLWARSTLKSGKRQRSVKRPAGGEVTARPTEDPVEAEMRRITEELRTQRRP
jgi:UPF0716 family protein affecting phage T7 exclusion